MYHPVLLPRCLLPSELLAGVLSFSRELATVHSAQRRHDAFAFLQRDLVAVTGYGRASEESEAFDSTGVNWILKGHAPLVGSGSHWHASYLS